MYEVKVITSDLSANTTTKTVKVLLDNWRQRIYIGKEAIVVGGDIVIQKAEQFVGNQTVQFYCIPEPVPGAATLASGTALPAGKKIGQKQTDGNGEAKNIVFKGKAAGPAGTYWVIADYDDDGEFNDRLDAAIKIEVKPMMPNQPVFAGPTAFEISHGWTLEVGSPGILATSYSPDWSNTRIALLPEPSTHYGGLDLRQDGSFTYVPGVPGPVGDSYGFELSSGGETSTPGGFGIDIRNFDPEPEDDMLFAVHDRPLQTPAGGGLLWNDFDWDGDPLSVVSYSPAQHGTLSVGSDGSVDYTPDPGFVGTDVFSYTVSDGFGQDCFALGTIEVGDQAPRTLVDAYTTAPDQTLSVPAAAGVLLNDSDDDGDGPTATLYGDPTYGPQHGVVTLNPDGSFTYTPDPGFTGYDSFLYLANDGVQSSDPEFVSIRVTNGALAGDQVWNDLNQDGLQDPTEPGVPGVTVTLVDPAGTLVAEAQTDNDGRFVFDVPPGTYRLQVAVPAGATVSPVHVGTDPASDSDVDPTGRSDLFTLAADDAVYDLDAGLSGSSLPLPAVEYGSATGRVWADANADGIRDGGEVGVSGVPVDLLDVGGAVIATVSTNLAGGYNFSNVPEGWYRVQVRLPAGAAASPQYQGGSSDADSDIDSAGVSGLFYVPASGTADHVDAGTVTGLVSGRVWLDGNGNGLLDTSEDGVAGVTVRLLDATGAVVATTTTAADGTYRFTNVANGQYRVQFVAPSGYTFTQPDQGSDESADSDVTDPGTGTTDLFSLDGDNRFNLSAGLIAL